MTARERQNVTIALDRDLHQQLTARCAALDVPVSIYIRSMLRQHLEQLEKGDTQ